MITSYFKPKSGSTMKKSSSPISKRNRIEVADGVEEKGNKENGDDKRQKTAGCLSKHQVSDTAKHLLSHLSNDSTTENITWRRALDRHVLSPGFASLAKFVANEREKGAVFPAECDTFTSLNMTDLENVKVVIVGQDPYHGPGQAHGLAFSVRRGIPIPPSLRNIYKELKEDDKVSFPAGNTMPTHGNLEKWANQGVLLLNDVLTVRRHEAHSHQKKGWEAFTDEIIRIVDRESRRNGRGVVFLLWGMPAAKKTGSVVSLRDATHEVICCSHPSPLSATRTNSPFIGSKCFSRANKALVSRGLEPIDWNV